MKTQIFATVILNFLTTTSAYNYRPYYHITANKGFINDPNGLSYFNNTYHFFYQHNPADVVSGNVHWGHVTSPDLIHWTHHPEAISPDEPYDEGGCFSGSAVVAEGKLLLVYTGNNNGGNSSYSNQTQCLAWSGNGEVFEKYEGNPVIRRPPQGGTEAFRDPKVWKHDDLWYMVAGNSDGDDGRAVIYKSANLTEWEYIGVLASSSNGSLGYMWECPDFFELDGRHVLIINPQGVQPSGDDFQNFDNTVYTVGTYNYTTNIFNHGDYYELDRGTDFYATQTFETPDGRRVLVAWMDMWGAKFKESNEGWAGVLTFPRQLSLNEEEKLMQQPIKESFQLFGLLAADANGLEVKGRKFWTRLETAIVFLEIDLTSQAKQIGFLLEDNNGEELLNFYYNRTEGKLIMVRGEDVRKKAVELSDTLELQVLIDKSSAEIFVESGSITFTARIYPKKIPSIYLISKGDKTTFSGEVFNTRNVNKETEIFSSA